MIHLSVCHGNKYLSANFLKQTYFSNSSLLVIITPNVFLAKVTMRDNLTAGLKDALLHIRYCSILQKKYIFNQKDGVLTHCALN